MELRKKPHPGRDGPSRSRLSIPGDCQSRRCPAPGAARHRAAAVPPSDRIVLPTRPRLRDSADPGPSDESSDESLSESIRSHCGHQPLAGAELAGACRATAGSGRRTAARGLRRLSQPRGGASGPGPGPERRVDPF
eukprot:634858-Hanusia_phi.AAC.1